jgi:hypothetical protein
LVTGRRSRANSSIEEAISCCSLSEDLQHGESNLKDIVEMTCEIVCPAFQFQHPAAPLKRRVSGAPRGVSGAGMRRLALRLVAALLVLALCAVPACATSSLSFEGDGYWIDLEVGFTEQPDIAAVRFYAPGDRKGVLLPSERVVVVAFDTQRHVLVLRYSGGPGTVPSFVLCVHDRIGLLRIGTRRIRSQFRWGL